ncbi:MAG: hypothetical protein V3V04_07565 [Rhizobiaceae bacterium]
MANDEINFQKMLGMWQEGQELFLRTQKEFAKTFQNSFSNSSSPDSSHDNAEPNHEDTCVDPLTEWQNLLKPWVPGMSYDEMMSGMKNKDDQRGRAEGFWAHQNLEYWKKFAPEQWLHILSSFPNSTASMFYSTQSEIVENWNEAKEFQKAGIQLAVVLNEAWEKAFMSYSVHFSLDDLKSSFSSQALEAWLKSANYELKKVQTSPAYLDAQKNMFRMALKIKARQKDHAEVLSEQLQIPTRTEIDDLAKTIHQLRRELRKVKRELTDIKGKIKD